jgi:hypothetical protein
MSSGRCPIALRRGALSAGRISPRDLSKPLLSRPSRAAGTLRRVIGCFGWRRPTAECSHSDSITGRPKCSRTHSEMTRTLLEGRKVLAEQPAKELEPGRIPNATTPSAMAAVTQTKWPPMNPECFTAAFKRETPDAAVKKPRPMHYCRWSVSPCLPDRLDGNRQYCLGKPTTAIARLHERAIPRRPRSFNPSPQDGMGQRPTDPAYRKFKMWRAEWSVFQGRGPWRS